MPDFDDAAVALSHLTADYEKVRTSGLRHVRRANDLMYDALHAIQSKSDAAHDLVDRAIEHAEEAMSALRTDPSRTIQTTPPRATSKAPAETAGCPAVKPAAPGRYHWDMDLEDDEPATFDEDTARIIDEDAGGVVAYVHKLNAPAVVAALSATPIPY